VEEILTLKQLMIFRDSSICRKK